MKRKRHTPEQIIRKLRVAASAIVEACDGDLRMAGVLLRAHDEAGRAPARIPAAFGVVPANNPAFFVTVEAGPIVGYVVLGAIAIGLAVN